MNLTRPFVESEQIDGCKSVDAIDCDGNGAKDPDHEVREAGKTGAAFEVIEILEIRCQYRLFLRHRKVKHSRCNPMSAPASSDRSSPDLHSKAFCLVRPDRAIQPENESDDENDCLLPLQKDVQ